MLEFPQVLFFMKWEEFLMNDWIQIGKIVNTHGIKGELRIRSDFDQKEKVFLPGVPIYIGKEKRKEIIKTYRTHKTFDMICYQNITNINEVLDDKNQIVYIKRKDLKLNREEYLLKDLITCKVIEKNEQIGQIIDIVYNKAGILLKVKNETKEFYIPKNDYFIKKVNMEKKIVETENAQGLIL